MVQRWVRTLLRRWLLAQPECASASEHQRGDAVDFVCREFKLGWLRGLITFIASMVIICVTMYLWDLLADRLALAPRGIRDVGMILIFLGTMALDTVATGWLFRRHAVALLRKRLIWLGIPLCRHCGYDLRGQAMPRCPECGRAFDPALLKQRGEEGGRAPR